MESRWECTSKDSFEEVTNTYICYFSHFLNFIITVKYCYSLSTLDVFFFTPNIYLLLIFFPISLLSCIPFSKTIDLKS